MLGRERDEGERGKGCDETEIKGRNREIGKCRETKVKGREDEKEQEEKRRQGEKDKRERRGEEKMGKGK